MIDQITKVFACLLLGEILSRTGILPFPGSVIGLVLLFADLLRRGSLPRPLSGLADHVLAFLGMLFVPAGVGVLAYQDLLRREMLPILAAVVGGTLVALGATTVVAGMLAAAEGRREARAQVKIYDATA